MYVDQRKYESTHIEYFKILYKWLDVQHSR